MFTVKEMSIQVLPTVPSPTTTHLTARVARRISLLESILPLHSSGGGGESQPVESLIRIGLQWKQQLRLEAAAWTDATQVTPCAATPSLTSIPEESHHTRSSGGEHHLSLLQTIYRSLALIFNSPACSSSLPQIACSRNPFFLPWNVVGVLFSCSCFANQDSSWMFQCMRCCVRLRTVWMWLPATGRWASNQDWWRWWPKIKGINGSGGDALRVQTHTDIERLYHQIVCINACSSRGSQPAQPPAEVICAYSLTHC